MVFCISFTGQDLEPRIRIRIRKPDPHPWKKLTQIAMSISESWGVKKFNKFVLPDRDIDSRAAAVNKFYMEE